MDKVRLGFVGTGFMGQLAHLSNFVMLREKCDTGCTSQWSWR